jgi:hypothetical protein
MDNISKKFNPSVAEDSSLTTEAIHLLNLFTFHTTTPSNRVRQYVEETFFSSSKDGSIPLLTNKGVNSSNLVRVATRDVPFLVNTPLLSDAMSTGAQGFITRLRDADMLKVAGWEDVRTEINGRTLSDTHAVQFFRWLLVEKLPAEQQRELLSLAVVIVGDEKMGKIINIGAVTSFVVPGRIPVEGGLPLTVLPLELGKTFSTRDLESLYVPNQR